MAEVKWIKIVTDIFDDEKMLLIESMPEADGIIVVWFKLLCMAGKQNNSGVFMLNDKIAYTDEMLATVFRRPLNTVRLALKTFETYGMIEIVDNVVTIPNWEKHQNLDQLELSKEKTRQRVARYRKKQKAIVDCNVTSNVTVTQCNADRIDIEEDIDKDNIICPNSDDLDVSEQLSLEEKSTGSNVIEVNISETIERIYKAFPRKEGKAKGFEHAIAFLKGRKIAGLGTVKYNHEQLYCAVRQYSFECEDNHTEERYIKLFSTFMNKPVCDYVEKSTEGYESYMERTYGNEWRNIKFTYR